MHFIADEEGLNPHMQRQSTVNAVQHLRVTHRPKHPYQRLSIIGI